MPRINGQLLTQVQDILSLPFPGEEGEVYIIQFERPVVGKSRPGAKKVVEAEFYIGWSKNPDGRLFYHQAGKGARLTAYAVELGIDMKIIWRHPGTRGLEKALKMFKNTRRVVRQLGL